MPTEDELKMQMASAIRERIVGTIVRNRQRILAAMAGQGVNLDLAQVSHLVSFYESSDGLQGVKCLPVPWYKGQPWPTRTQYHDRCIALAGLEGRYRDEVLFDWSGLIEKKMGGKGFSVKEEKT
ncbi:MAG: hypothetical protein ACO4B5_12605 [Steroidobacteraceae bacterium]